MAAVGRHDSSGGFSLDLQHSLRKLQVYQHPEPEGFLRHLVTAAVAMRATRIRLEVTEALWELEWDGESLSFYELTAIFPSLLSPQPGRVGVALRELALALNHLRSLGGSRVLLVGREGEMELQPAFLQISPSWSDREGVLLRIFDSPRPRQGPGHKSVTNVFSSLVRGVLGGKGLPALQLEEVVRASRYCGLERNWNGQRAPAEVTWGRCAAVLRLQGTSALPPVRVESDFEVSESGSGPGSLVLGLFPEDDPGWSVVCGGLTFGCSAALRTPLPARVLMIHDGLKRDLLGIQLVQDEELAALQALAVSWLGRLCQRATRQPDLCHRLEDFVCSHWGASRGSFLHEVTCLRLRDEDRLLSQRELETLYQQDRLSYGANQARPGLQAALRLYFRPRPVPELVHASAAHIARHFYSAAHFLGARALRWTCDRHHFLFALEGVEVSPAELRGLLDVARGAPASPGMHELAVGLNNLLALAQGEGQVRVSHQGGTIDFSTCLLDESAEGSQPGTLQFLLVGELPPVSPDEFLRVSEYGSVLRICNDDARPGRLDWGDCASLVVFQGQVPCPLLEVRSEIRLQLVHDAEATVAVALAPRSQAGRLTLVHGGLAFESETHVMPVGARLLVLSDGLERADLGQCLEPQPRLDALMELARRCLWEAVTRSYGSSAEVRRQLAAAVKANGFPCDLAVLPVGHEAPSSLEDLLLFARRFGYLAVDCEPELRDALRPRFPVLFQQRPVLTPEPPEGTLFACPLDQGLAYFTERNEGACLWVGQESRPAPKLPAGLQVRLQAHASVRLAMEQLVRFHDLLGLALQRQPARLLGAAAPLRLALWLTLDHPRLFLDPLAPQRTSALNFPLRLYPHGTRALSQVLFRPREPAILIFGGPLPQSSFAGEAPLWLTEEEAWLLRAARQRHREAEPAQPDLHQRDDGEPLRSLPQE